MVEWYVTGLIQMDSNNDSIQTYGWYKTSIVTSREVATSVSLAFQIQASHVKNQS